MVSMQNCVQFIEYFLSLCLHIIANIMLTTGNYRYRFYIGNWGSTKEKFKKQSY